MYFPSFFCSAFALLGWYIDYTLHLHIASNIATCVHRVYVHTYNIQ